MEKSCNHVSLEELLHKNVYKENGFHLAAFQGTLGELNPSLITEENLLLENRNGWNCFHYACFGNYLDKFPKRFVKVKYLTKKTNTELMPIWYFSNQKKNRKSLSSWGLQIKDLSRNWDKIAAGITNEGNMKTINFPDILKETWKEVEEYRKIKNEREIS